MQYFYLKAHVFKFLMWVEIISSELEIYITLLSMYIYLCICKHPLPRLGSLPLYILLCCELSLKHGQA
jgi:hypothetical protein